MNKSRSLIIFICIGVLLLGVGVISGYGFAKMPVGNTTTTAPITSQKSEINADRATEIALKDAGFKADEVDISTHPDHEDGISIYEVDFVAKGKKYEYEIVAETGEIYSKKCEVTTFRHEEESASGKYIGIDEAKLIALKHADIAEHSNIVFKKAKLERDDGKMLYEIEFVEGNMEYEYEIDAVSGKVLSFDSELDD